MTSFANFLRFPWMPCWAQLPMPAAAKADPLPMHKRLVLDDCQNLQDDGNQRYGWIREPAILVREPDATLQLAPHTIS
jgi:hypothetical protein